MIQILRTPRFQFGERAAANLASAAASAATTKRALANTSNRLLAFVVVARSPTVTDRFKPPPIQTITRTTSKENPTKLDLILKKSYRFIWK